MLSHPTNLFIDNLYLNKIINDRTFLFDIKSVKDTGNSNLLFGSDEIQQYLGKDQYNKLISNKFNVFPYSGEKYSYWSIRIESISIGSSRDNGSMA